MSKAAESLVPSRGRRKHTERRSLSPDEQALVARHRGLVGVHLRHYVHGHAYRRPPERADLFQEGCLALIRTALRHGTQGDGFVPLALSRIRGQVHAALHRQFSLIRIPRRYWNDPNATPQVKTTGNLDTFAARDTPQPWEQPDPDADSIRHLIHARYERAIRSALGEVTSRDWRRPNATRIFERIASERFLVPADSARTPLRLIARQEDISTGRAYDYEAHLARAASAYFARDPQVVMLVHLARKHPLGFAAIPDRHQLRHLAEAPLASFMQAFASLDLPLRALILYVLLARLGHVEESVRNLYLLAAPGEDIAFLAATARSSS